MRPEDCTWQLERAAVPEYDPLADVHCTYTRGAAFAELDAR